MTEPDREKLIERLVQATGQAAYASEARSWTAEQLRRAVEAEEAAVRAVERHGHLGAVWRASAEDAAELARRA